MSESSSTSHSSEPIRLGPILRRLILLVGLIALGTVASLWVVGEFLAPRDLRVPEGAPVVEGTSPTRDNFSPVAVVGRQPVVQGWKVLTAKEADQQLRDDEMLLGVVVNGKARAWPLNVMTGPEREIFNDEFEGRPIAATW
jgi:hypothetical protein